jgi:hypothetical protein
MRQYTKRNYKLKNLHAKSCKQKHKTKKNKDIAPVQNRDKPLREPAIVEHKTRGDALVDYFLDVKPRVVS